MAQPRIRNRRKPPAPATRTMDLLGVGKDGNLYVWQEAGTVQPMSKFPRDGKHIKSGHYVIERNGKAITVHCSNLADGRIGVQYMCGGLPDRYVPAELIEPTLVGRVIPDPVLSAQITRMLHEATERLAQRAMAPHLRRGPA